VSDNLVVVDTSVAMKWSLNENGKDEALALLDELETFLVPEFFLVEVDSVLTKRVRIRDITKEEAEQIRVYYRELPFRLISHDQIDESAFELSCLLNVNFFDSLFLSTALKFDSMVYTADKRFYNALQTTAFKDLIRKIF
jgi:predicted nucleic acid-binding protein